MTAPILTDLFALLDSQRETAFADCAGLDEAAIWRRPGPQQWSIGEILDHNRVLFESTLALFKVHWRLTAWLAVLRRRRPYPVEIHDVYRDPAFPMQVGRLWPPRKQRIAFEQLQDEIRATHRKVRAFYAGKPEDVLGNDWLYDPVIGWVNYLTALRIGIYHDQLHFDDVRKLAERWRGQSASTPG